MTILVCCIFVHAYLKWEIMGILDIHVFPITITCLLQGTLCNTGIPCTFYGENICSVQKVQSIFLNFTYILPSNVNSAHHWESSEKQRRWWGGCVYITFQRIFNDLLMDFQIITRYVTINMEIFLERSKSISCFFRGLVITVHCKYIQLVVICTVVSCSPTFHCTPPRPSEISEINWRT